MALNGQATAFAIGRSAAWCRFLERAARVAPLGVTVLIRGETGSGKEIAAKLIVAMGRRAEAPFVAVNCAALPEALVESELFGHARGAFSGATEARRGLFEEAQRGTIFLDEIGALPLPAQAKLLRALEERCIRGCEEPARPVDVGCRSDESRRRPRLAPQFRATSASGSPRASSSSAPRSGRRPPAPVAHFLVRPRSREDLRADSRRRRSACCHAIRFRGT